MIISLPVEKHSIRPDLGTELSNRKCATVSDVAYGVATASYDSLGAIVILSGYTELSEFLV